MEENNENAVSSTYRLTCNKCELLRIFVAETEARNGRREHEDQNSGHKVKITVVTSGPL